jgi:hypothetical protein
LLAREFRQHFRLGSLQCSSRVHAGKKIHASGERSGPTGLVGSAEAGAIVAMEILIKQNVVPPVRVVLELL